MDDKHSTEKENACNFCGKTFHLKWRLEKHKEIHDKEKSLKYCHFFNNHKVCPYEEIGCKFLHVKSERCKFTDCRNPLCQFSHNDEKDNLESDEDEEEFDETADISENQCHLCREQFTSKDEHIDHVRSEHVVYYQGMLEVAARMRE